MLLSRTPWTLAMLAAVEAGKLASGELDPVRLKLLAEHRDAEVRGRAAKLLARAEAQPASRGRGCLPRHRWKWPATPPAASWSFTKICAACHKVGGVGHEIGPNLAAMKARGPEAILLNVLDPNREVNPQYLNYSVLLADGRNFTGLIAAETATSLTLRRAENQTDTILRIDIEQLKSTGQSLMPEGVEKQIDKQGMADLLEYLKTAE